MSWKWVEPPPRYLLPTDLCMFGPEGHCGGAIIWLGGDRYACQEHCTRDMIKDVAAGIVGWWEAQ